jgi:ABC-type multidrug transport system ATPase subunit
LAPALELDSVFQHVAGRCALADISLRLEPGEWLLIIGPNGAGKSLLTRLILGLDAASAGTIRVFGQELSALGTGAMRRLRQRIGGVLQGGSLLEDLTVLENLLLPLRNTPLEREGMARAARLTMTQLLLDGLENHAPRALSLGQRRRVELARALIHRPELLVWDGLTDGLDPAGVQEILEVLNVPREDGKLTFIATDNRAGLALPDPDRIAVLDRGQLLFCGPPAELERAADERLELRYLLRGHP